MIDRTRYFEAEAAELYGSASVDSEHSGYSGDGFVSGYGHGGSGAATTFWVDVPSADNYYVALCYGNGTRSAKTLTIYINNERVKQVRLPSASRWNMWMTNIETLPLKSGLNTISYRKDPSDTGEVNLDFIGIQRN